MAGFTPTLCVHTSIPSKGIWVLPPYPGLSILDGILNLFPPPLPPPPPPTFPVSQLHLSPGAPQAPRFNSPGPYGFQSPSSTPHPTAPPITTYTSPYGTYPPQTTPPRPPTSPGYPPGSPYHYQHPSQYATPPHMQVNVHNVSSLHPLLPLWHCIVHIMYLAMIDGSR